MRCGEFIRSDIGDYKKGWKCCLRLALIPVCLCDYANVIDSLSPQFIDICKHIAGTDISSDGRFHQEKRISKLSFDTKFFIPPLTLIVAETTLFFDKLKSYIRSVSVDEGSPVICSGGNTKRHFNYFTCSKNKAGHKNACPFSFQVRGDDCGYYIHLLLHLTNLHQIGTSWHC